MAGGTRRERAAAAAAAGLDRGGKDRDFRSNLSVQSATESVSFETLLPRWHPCRIMADHSCLCVFVGLNIVFWIVAVGIATLPVSIETDFDSFLITDVESSLQYSASEAAWDARAEVSRRRLQEEDEDNSQTVYSTKDLFFEYELAGDGKLLKGGLLHHEAIGAIRRFEDSVISQAGWIALCNRVDESVRDLCSRGMSFTHFVLPTLAYGTSSIIPESLVLDGGGFDPVSMQTALMLVEKQNLKGLFLPTEFNWTSTGDATETPHSHVLRSAFRFRLPCCTTEDSLVSCRSKSVMLTLEWEDFFREVVLPQLELGVTRGGDELKLMDVWYSGSSIDVIEVKLALSGDYGLAVASAVYVFAYILFHTRSLLLASVGPLIALSAVPLTFVFCAVGIGTTTVSFANFLSLFLIVGFGADVIFVYTDFWNESSDYRAGCAERLAWTYMRAIKSSVTTTGTTALAFLANLASVIRALRQFGFFMGMCVALAWLLITAIYAPLLVLNQKIKCRKCLDPNASMLAEPTRRRKHSDSIKIRFFVCYMRVLHRFRRCVVLIAIALAAAALGVAIPQVRQAESVPSMFDPEHNQNKGEQVRALFDRTKDSFGANFVPPPREETVCNGPQISETETPCALHWCEANAAFFGTRDEWRGSGECVCYRKDLPPSECGDTAFVPVSMALVSLTSLSANQFITDVGDYFVSSGEVIFTEKGATSRFAMKKEQEGPPVFVQDWETGLTLAEDVFSVTGTVMRTNTSGSSCGVEVACYCGSVVCKPSPDLNNAPPLVLRSWDRRMMVQIDNPVTPQSKQTKLRIYFGLSVPTSVKLLGETDISQSWSLMESFDITQPWTQRYMYEFCREFPSELRVIESWCWMRDFRVFARQHYGRFPVRSMHFDEFATRFAAETNSATRGDRYIFLRGQRIKAVQVSTSLDFDENAPAAKALTFKEKWDKYLSDWNSKVDAKATGAFHASTVWVKAETTSILIISTLETLAILFILSFLAMFLFTQSCALSFCVCFATLIVVVGLLFSVVVIAQLEIGLIEVIAIIYFIGYALDYSLHIAYKYSSHEALKRERLPNLGSHAANVRMQRTMFAVKSMGGAVTGSAMTTAGAAFFLVFCNLTLFQKLGAMCLMVTLFSVIIALGPLPAALMMFGPVDPGCCRRWRRRIMSPCGREEARE